MISLVEIENAQGATLALPLREVSEGLYIQEIEGLEPVKATIVSSGFAQMDGSQYQSSRRESRNLVFKLGIDPDFKNQTPRDVRNTLYNFLMPKTEVKVTFVSDDMDTVEIYGRVETLDPKIFAKDQVATSSVICFDPDFKALDTNLVPGFTTSDDDELDVLYEGTVETGVELQININRSISELTIYHRSPDGSVRTMDISAPLVAGDVLTIVTVSGNKGVVLTRAGVDSSLLYATSPQSYWLELLRGINHIRLYTAGAPIPYTITYRDRYGGL